MGWRFRKSVTILPGVRVNFGLHSTSLSVGGKGFRTTYNSTGRVTRSIGIPGTGLSYVSSSGGSRRTRSDPTDYRGNKSVFAATDNFGYLQSSNMKNDSATASSEQIATQKKAINEIICDSDISIAWKHVLLVDSDPDIPNFDYFKSKVDKILDGDLDTYFEVVSDINPLDDLLKYGSGFECGTDDPRMIGIHFQVNSKAVLANVNNYPTNIYNELLQDYVCGCTIRVARDMFALLPVKYVLVDATNNNDDILSVKFERRIFDETDFSTIDASSFIEGFEHRMDFDISKGFRPIFLLND